MIESLSDGQVRALPARTRIDALVDECEVLVRWIGTALVVFGFCLIVSAMSIKGAWPRSWRHA